MREGNHARAPLMSVMSGSTDNRPSHLANWLTISAAAKLAQKIVD